VETMLKYDGYIQREEAAARRFKKMEGQRIPEEIDYGLVPDLKTEVREKLRRTRPVSLGQAMRIPGMTPAAVAVLQVYIRGLGREVRG
jgi:tRNA uridine 5-carboxymethylaminomethyl modification enzyme